MSRKTMMRALVAAVLLVAAAIISMVYYIPDEPEVSFFPEQLEFRIELRHGEELRVVQYYPDGLTPKHAIADHIDGKVSNYWFYETTGKMKEARTQSEEIDGKRQLLRHSRIAPDGVTFISDTKYSLDGIKIEESVLVSDEVTDRKHFYISTGKLHKHQTIEKKEKVGWIKTAELVYAKSGYLYSQFAMAEDGSTSTTVFTEDKKIAARFSMDKYRSRYEEHWYFADEKTVRRHVEQLSSGTRLKLYREDGSLAESYYWAGFVDKGGVLIHKLFNEAGVQSFEQYFGYHAGHGYHLWSVSLYRKDGSDYRSIYFTGRSKTATSETVYYQEDPKDKDRILRYFDENERVTRIREFKDGEWLEEKHFTPEEAEESGQSISYPKEWLEFPSYEAPPQVIPYRPMRGPGYR